MLRILHRTVKLEQPNQSSWLSRQLAFEDLEKLLRQPCNNTETDEYNRPAAAHPGFVIYPTQRRLKGRKLRHSTRHLKRRYAQWRNGNISFAEFDANIQAWINHARYADSWHLREKVFQDFDLSNRLSL